MRFLLDHDVPDEVEQLLRYWKHDVQRLREALPVTTADNVIFDFAQQQGRIIPSPTPFALACPNHQLSTLNPQPPAAALPSPQVSLFSHHPRSGVPERGFCSTDEVEESVLQVQRLEVNDRLMSVREIEDALRATPFVPFEIHLDNGKTVQVPHQDFLLFSESKTTIVVTSGGRLHIMAVDHITSLSLAESP